MSGLDKVPLRAGRLTALVEVLENFAAIGGSKHLCVNRHYLCAAFQECVVSGGVVGRKICLKQVHVRILLQIPPTNCPIPCRRRREPPSGQAEVTRNKFVGFAKPIQGVLIRENRKIVGKTKHYKGMAIQIFGRVVRSIVVVQTEIPSTVCFIPEMADQVREQATGTILKEAISRQAISL